MTDNNTEKMQTLSSRQNQPPIEPTASVTPRNEVNDKENKNRIKRFLDESPIVTIIVVVFSILAFLMGLINSYFILEDKFSQISQSLSISFRSINMFVDDMTVTVHEYQKYFLPKRPFYENSKIYELNKKTFVELMSADIDIRIINQKKEPKALTRLILFIQPNDTDAWLVSGSYQIIDEKTSKDAITLASIPLAAREIKDVGLRFYFGPQAKRALKNTCKDKDNSKAARLPGFQRFYLVITDEQGEIIKVSQDGSEAMTPEEYRMLYKSASDYAINNSSRTKQ